MISPLRSAKPTGGFSLVEVVIALGLSAFALTSLIALLPAGMVASRDSRGSLEAFRAADRVIADMRVANTNAGGVFESGLYKIRFSDATNSIHLVGESGNGRQIAEVCFVNRPGTNGTEPGLYEVVVSVFWGLPQNASSPPASYNSFVRLYGAFTK